MRTAQPDGRNETKKRNNEPRKWRPRKINSLDWKRNQLLNDSTLISTFDSWRSGSILPMTINWSLDNQLFLLPWFQAPS